LQARSIVVIIIKMKSVQIIVAALVIACASAFAPVAQKSVAFKPLAASKIPEPVKEVNHQVAALAAFATAAAPLAANAESLESQAIGLGIGLVACVVSLAVGFAIGYGTLVKP
jgi:hypothetical protein